jgi:hypothetical protein
MFVRCSLLLPCVLGLAAPFHSRAATLANWEFEVQPGFLADSSGGGRTLVIDAPTVAPSASTVNLGQSAELSGGGYVSTPDASVWTDATMTVEVLFNATNAANSSTQVLVGQWNGGAGQRSWVVGLNDGRVRILQSADGVSTSTNLNVLSVASGKDYYLGLIVDGRSGRVVLKNLTDGTPEESVVIDGLVPALKDSTAPLTIGSTAQATSPFAGRIGRVQIQDEAVAGSDLLFPLAPPANPKADGYKGLWFNLGQYSTYGPKYSGGLATYTAKHRPMAVYAPAVRKTFFTYGGTTRADENHLLIMAGWYDHVTGRVPRPTIVMDKAGVDDPHDNAAIQLDRDGYVYVFVSGRNTSRNGVIYRSDEPYSIESFERISPEGGAAFTYPQIWYLPGSTAAGDEQFFFLFTRYTGGRELYFQRGPDAQNWNPAAELAGMGGHYQVSGHSGNRIGTAFNRHPNGNVDRRTDLYYTETDDFGASWHAANGTALALPLRDPATPARVIDYAAQGRLVYVKDLVFDGTGRPHIFYLTSADYRPGPPGEPRLLHVTSWTGTQWRTSTLPTAATASSTVIHNYNTGSLDLAGGVWTAIIPSGAGSAPTAGATQAEIERYWGQGGEMETWVSEDEGGTWVKRKTITRDSPRKPGYARSPQDAADPFFAFWADGNPEVQSEVHLFFGNRDGSQYWELPYDLTSPSAEPRPKKSGYTRWAERFVTPDAVTSATGLGRGENPDGDAASNRVEFLFGTNPLDSTDAPSGDIEDRPASGQVPLRLSLTLNPEAADVAMTIMESSDLVDWSLASSLVETGRTPLADGRVRLEFSQSPTAPTVGGPFFRLQVTD